MSGEYPSFAQGYGGQATSHQKSRNVFSGIEDTCRRSDYIFWDFGRTVAEFSGGVPTP